MVFRSDDVIHIYALYLSHSVIIENPDTVFIHDIYSLVHERYELFKYELVIDLFHKICIPFFLLILSHQEI